tara:strand:- start:5289 stop:10073 length:4785 start_codon:yes stop_codon:yes gene_type:complete
MHKMIQKIILNRLLSFLFVISNISVFFSATISGKIVDKKTKQSLIGANIFIELDSDMMGSATDVDGLYRIENVPEGSFDLKVSYLGYESFTLSIDIEDIKKDYNFDLELSPSSIKVDEIIVKDERRKEKKTEAPASKEIISSRDIRRSTTTNLGGYLKGLKGVDFTSSGVNNFSVSIRGFNSSFSTRLLMLTDGRVANVPALRVINFSTIPQSTDDVDKIEVVLGPATALYGSNAHSGVINVISKPPSTSEGFKMSFSGSNDEREMKKFNTRIAKKMGNLSFKVSGEYVHANEWPYISEEEFKIHQYPWSGYPHRRIDKKDNNPWDGISLGGGSNNDAITETNNYGNIVRIGNGEKNHEDEDGDGVAGEDWYNGVDDDGDAVDSDLDGWCDGQEMRWANQNGTINQQAWLDPNNFPSEHIEAFSNWIDEDYFYSDGIDNDNDGKIDEAIDAPNDIWYDGTDNDGNGDFDESGEIYSDPSLPYGNWALSLENGIIIRNGKKPKIINGIENPFYSDSDWEDFHVIDPNDPNNEIISPELGECELCTFIASDSHIRGDMRYNEDFFGLEFDLFTHDYGDDRLAGDPFIDLSGDNQFQRGESLNCFGLCDYGLDGLQAVDENGDGDYDDTWEVFNPFTNQLETYSERAPDEGEGDGIWQPGDGWVDTNNNGILELFADNWQSSTENSYNDVWPLGNGEWDSDWYGQSEQILDYGQDGYDWDPNNDGWIIGQPYQAYDQNGLVVDENGDPVIIFGPDAGEDGLELAYDNNELDGQMDLGNGIYNHPEVLKEFDYTEDINADGILDYPDFEVENKKAEIRIDYDPSNDFNLTFQTGYSWTKTQQVTGIGRFLTEGWESTFYQLRGTYKDWYAQAFYNKSNSGSTRNYNIGQLIDDQSSNLGLQIQNEFFIPTVNTEITWGFDYAKTMPKTFGSILNDGPNGYDDDGDNFILQNDGIDNNLDGYIDNDSDGIDEPDEYSEIESNEFGAYLQSKTDLLGNGQWELITAARLDHHDQIDEGIQFGPKIGINYKPNDISTWRLTYGLAFNTPTITTLYTDLYYGKLSIFDVFLKGNKDGTPYTRVPKEGDDYYYVNGVPYSYNFNPKGPGYLCPDPCPYETDEEGYIAMSLYDNIFTEGYADRILGAPFYYNLNSSEGPSDYLPIDTDRHYIYIPFADGDGGVSYTASETYNIEDVDPLGPERNQTVEFGYKGFISKKTYLAADLYISQFDDFFSPATIITPQVKRYGDNATIGLLPVTSDGSNPPYGTAWDGQDNDNDWYGCDSSINDCANFFATLPAPCFTENCSNYIENPYDDDGMIVMNNVNAGVDMAWSEAFNWLPENFQLEEGQSIEDFILAGQWGYVEWVAEQEDPTNILGYTIYHPWEVLNPDFSFKLAYTSTVNTEADQQSNLGWVDVGVDEYAAFTGLNEAERIQTGLIDANGNPAYGVGRPTQPPNIILSSLNYGNVLHSGVDIALTHFINKRLIIDTNFAIFNSTDYYNTLTKQYDPINAPKFKLNTSIKWDSDIGDIMLAYRYVDKFDWKDGIWSGVIGPYSIVDIHYNKTITDNIALSISAMNIFDDFHRELIGGAEMGRQIILRMTSSF